MVIRVRVFLRVCANLLRCALWPIWLALRSASRPRGKYVYLKLEKRLTELRGTEPLWRRVRSMRGKPGLGSLEELRQLARQIGRDPAIEGLCISVSSVETGWASLESVRQLVRALRNDGKRVVVYLSEGGGNRELFLASAADKIVMTPWTALGPLGFASQPLYFKRLLDRIGVQVDVQATGQYKSAAEPLLRESMSDASREQQQALLDSLQSALDSALMERGLSRSQLDALFSAGLLGAQGALELGIVDELRYEDELQASLASPAQASTTAAPALAPVVAVDRATPLAFEREVVLEPVPAAPPSPERPNGARPEDGEGDDEAARGWTSARAYLAYHRPGPWRPLHPPPYVAVVRVSGAIAQERRGLGPAADRGSIVAALRKAAADPFARAVVLYVNSPGGSALASELIHREVQRLGKKKPVVAYFGDVAASGGYYVAMACRSVVAQPLTVTGSIGVISAKLALAPLIDRLGIDADGLRTAPYADMMTWLRALTPDERAILEAHTAELYGRFLEVVSQGRRRPVAEIEPLAKGRVWSGRDAHAHGLVDALGGIEIALEQARAHLPELTSAERDQLTLRLCTGKADGSQLPPQAGGEGSTSWRDDLSFLVGSRREPASFYALDVSSGP